MAGSELALPAASAKTVLLRLGVQTLGLFTHMWAKECSPIGRFGRVLADSQARGCFVSPGCGWDKLRFQRPSVLETLQHQVPKGQEDLGDCRLQRVRKGLGDSPQRSGPFDHRDVAVLGECANQSSRGDESIILWPSSSQDKRICSGLKVRHSTEFKKRDN